MFSIGQKIENLRKEKNLTREDLAKEIGISAHSIFNYETEKRLIPIDILNQIAIFFSIPIESFFSKYSNNIGTSKKEDTKRIPIISKASAGLELKGIDDVIEWIEISRSISHNANFATFIDEDSMEPKIYDDDLVLVFETSMLDSGEIGIFYLNGDIYCKKFQYNQFTKETLLKSLNPIYKSIKVQEEDEFRVIGKVVGVFDYTI